jgi:hypothetical protein
MRRRKLLAALAVGLLALLLLGVIIQVWQGPAIGPAGFARIREGMTRAEVAAAIGMPAGDYSNRSCCGAARALAQWGCDSTPEGEENESLLRIFVQAAHGLEDCVPEDDENESIYWESWIGDRYILEVRYGVDDKTVGCALAEIISPDGNYLDLDSLLWRAKQLWCRWFP